MTVINATLCRHGPKQKAHASSPSHTYWQGGNVLLYISRPLLHSPAGTLSSAVLLAGEHKAERSAQQALWRARRPSSTTGSLRVGRAAVGGGNAAAPLQQLAAAVILVRDHLDEHDPAARAAGARACLGAALPEAAGMPGWQSAPAGTNRAGPAGHGDTARSAAAQGRPQAVLQGGSARVRVLLRLMQRGHQLLLCPSLRARAGRVPHPKPITVAPTQSLPGLAGVARAAAAGRALTGRRCRHAGAARGARRRAGSDGRARPALAPRGARTRAAKSLPSPLCMALTSAT